MILYEPSKLLKKIAPKRKIERLLSSRLTLKKTALSFVSDIPFLDKGRISEVALKTIRGYQERVAREVVDSNLEKSAGDELKADLLDNPKQLIQRVQNEIVSQVAEGIKEKYAGEAYTWLPSSADEPDPEHQLNYGKVFQIGVGEMPGDRYGCQCGMEIQVKETQLKL